jgi:hypothetical protein
MGTMLKLSLLLPLVVAVGCDLPLSSKPAQERQRYEWDVSENRSASAFQWFDFDPIRGAIDEPAQLVFRFDREREFRGNVELITFDRADASATKLKSFSINLPPQTASEVVKTLRALAADWKLDTTRLNQDTPQILQGTDYRGIVLVERNSPSIDVTLCNSFNQQSPYSLTISWSWPSHD